MEKMICDSNNFTITKNNNINLSKAQCQYDYEGGINQAKNITFGNNDQ